MIDLKSLALSGAVLSLAATGLAFAQQPASPPASATASPPAAAPAASGPASQTPAGDAAVSDRDASTDDAGMMGDDDDDDGFQSGDEARPMGRGGPGNHHPMDRMGRMDRDGDGAIEKSEFGGRRAERLHGADKNGDGVLSSDEIEAMVLKQMAERRARRLTDRLDVDGDGRVTLAEIDALRNKTFAVLDRNDDGRIDRRELREIHRELGGPGGREGGPEMGMRGGRHGFGRHGGRFDDGGRGPHHDGSMEDDGLAPQGGPDDGERDIR